MTMIYGYCFFFQLWRNSYKKEDVVPALRRSLENLDMKYVDLFLIHWPTAFKVNFNRLPVDE